MKPLCFCHAYSLSRHAWPWHGTWHVIMWSCSCNVSYLLTCRVDTAATRLPLPAWACHSDTHIVTIDGGYHRCFVRFMLLCTTFQVLLLLFCNVADPVCWFVQNKTGFLYFRGFCARHWPQLHFLNFLWVRESLPGYIGVVCCECEVVNLLQWFF